MADEKNISYQPTDGLSYDPEDAIYWSDEALAKEVERAFEICHGCRMCFKYCDSFPSLFGFIDDEDGAHGDVRKLTAEQVEAVMTQCFQCKLCEVQCPYTPRDGHEFQLDFPKLVHRWSALRARDHGLSLRERLLGDPDGTAELARMTFGLMNKANRSPANRWLMEKTVGIHRDKLLPDFAGQTFEQWAEKEGLMRAEPGGPTCEAVLFQTCFVQHNEPEIGRDTVEVLRRNGVDVRCVKGLVCCGMPAWEHGDLAGLKRRAHVNLELLAPYVDAGAKVLVINPTCSMMLRREYPELLGGHERHLAEKVAEAVMDPSEFLWSLRKEERFNTEFASSPGGNVAYHAPCHLRAQGKGFKGRDLMRKLPDVKIATVMECCGHNGTYAMRRDGFEPSARLGKKAFDAMKGADASVWATDCPLAAIQFAQHAGKKPLHPMSVLARAYRGDDFDEH